MNIDDIEHNARCKIVDLAKKHHLYFVVRDGHLERSFIAHENKRKKLIEIYGSMYESYYDLVGDDKVKFMFKISNKFKWIDMLNIIIDIYANENQKE